MEPNRQHQSCIEACLQCASACNYCASSCLREADVSAMARCVQLDMECAAICYASAQLMSLGSEQTMMLCTLCADLCDACGAECEKHNNEHCRSCALACRTCAEECRKMNNR